MKPENTQAPGTGAEQSYIAPNGGAEQVPVLPSLGQKMERGQERSEQVAEAGARVSDAMSSTAAMPQPVVPVVPTAGLSAGVMPVASMSSPMVAGNEDLIEKEWVDRAKGIITETRDDPHKRSQKVNELQRDYLQKRYGKVIGAGGD